MTEFIKKAFKEDERKAYYFTLYTLLFGIVAFLCFSWFIFNGKSMIFTGDGNRQHHNTVRNSGVYCDDRSCGKAKESS